MFSFKTILNNVDCIIVRLLKLQTAPRGVLPPLCDYSFFDVLEIEPERPDWNDLDMVS